MDGNGRWASQRNLRRIQGHAAGETAMLRTVRAAAEMGIKWLTLFAFSTENWGRPVDEVRFLMRLNRHVIRKHGPELHSKNVRVRYMGQPDARVPPGVHRAMDGIQELTANNTGLTLTMAFNYGGRAEIMDVYRRMLADGIQADGIDEALVKRYLPFPDMPDADLVIRTSGESRLSNFMLWRGAYSELVFMDVQWPDFGKAHLLTAIATYRRRNRRYGRLGRPQSEPRAESMRFAPSSVETRSSTSGPSSRTA